MSERWLHICLFHGARETLHMLRKTSQGSRGRGRQYHKSCHLPPTPKRPLHWSPSWLRGVCTHREWSWGKLAMETKQDNWPGGKQRPGSPLINVLTSKSHNSYSCLSAFAYSSFCRYSTCLINTLISSAVHGRLCAWQWGGSDERAPLGAHGPMQTRLTLLSAVPSFTPHPRQSRLANALSSSVCSWRNPN